VDPAPLSRLCLAADLDAAAATLARAFLDDPMVTWLLGAPHEHDGGPETWLSEAANGFFIPCLTAGRRRGHTYMVNRGDRQAVALWLPPDTSTFTADERGELIAALSEHCGPEALERIGSLGELVSEHHPDERPHFYLFLLGADPRGQGLGNSVMDPVLERCDDDALPAYLESSNPRNLAFYQRHGFQVVWEDRPDGGPVMRGLWREPW
jgi:GNAT superfamily N-acetyltransferase